jgi:hypothetical protein
VRAENLYIGACADGRLALSGNFGNVDPAAFNRLPEADRLRAIGSALLSAASFRGKAFDAALASEDYESHDAGVNDALQVLRVVVDASKDARTRRAFNVLLGHHKRALRSRAIDAALSDEGTAARARHIKPEPDGRYAALQAMYDAIRTGKRQEAL